MSEAPGPGGAGPQTQQPPTPPRRPLPPTEPERGGMRALVMGAAGIGLMFVFPLVGIPLCVAAVVTGIRSRKRARRILAPVPGATAGIVLGSIGLALSVLSIVVASFVSKDLVRYTECHQSAITITDKRACQDTYFPRIERRLHMPQGTLEQHRSWWN